MTRLALLIASAALWCGPVAAHPHIFVDAGAELNFDSDHRLIGLRHVWTYDAFFSVWLLLDVAQEDDPIRRDARLDAIALGDVAALDRLGFYTRITVDGAPLDLRAGDTVTMRDVDGRLRMEFHVVPVDPPKDWDRIAVSIFDPHYYTAFAFADGLRTIGLPESCGVEEAGRAPLSPRIRARLARLPADVQVLPPELAAALAGTEGAFVIDCAP